jgi:hypothetical protein
MVQNLQLEAVTEGRPSPNIDGRHIRASVYFGPGSQTWGFQEWIVGLSLVAFLPLYLAYTRKFLLLKKKRENFFNAIFVYITISSRSIFKSLANDFLSVIFLAK